MAPAREKSGKKASPAKKVPKSAKKAKGAKPTAGMAARPPKCSICSSGLVAFTETELMKVTGWQPHSVRGFLSGTLRKKMGIAAASTEREDGERSYSIKS